MDVKKRLDPKKNPFFSHAAAELFLAERGGRIVGRIAAIVDERHNEIHRDDVGFFGWFECENDPEAAAALIDSAREWVKKKGRGRLRGPVNSSLNEECGLLVNGFDRPPVMMMPYNPPYYEPLVVASGLRRVMDLHSFHLPVMSFGADRMERIVAKVKAREGATVRPFDMKDFEGELERLKRIYNDAWTENWGFVPLTDAELDAMARDLKPILEPRLASFVEVNGEPIGFSLVLPNINEILKTMNGRLFPFGIFKLLFGAKKIPSIRLIAMGVKKDWHMRGLDAVLYYDAFVASRDLGKTWSDIGWVLDTNQVMINTIERIGGTKYKTHRLFEGPV